MEEKIMFCLNKYFSFDKYVVVVCCVIGSYCNVRAAGNFPFETSLAFGRSNDVSTRMNFCSDL